MVDRVKAAEYSMDKIVRSMERNNENFRDTSYFLAFERYKNTLTHIKEYTKSISKLKGYKRYLQAIDVKKKFEQLTNDFDKCMGDLHFAIDVVNVDERREESKRVDKALKEVDETLQQIDDKLDIVVQGINFIKSHMNKQGEVHAHKIEPSELVDPTVQTVRGKIVKRIYRSLDEVACKPLDGQNETELAILGKLGQSPKILTFYGCSDINNSKVMIFEWAEHGNLKEVYDKFDIPWTRRIRIARDVLLGLLFLRTVNIFHHDVSVKLGNFESAREVNGISTNLTKLAPYIIRWMAPELIKKYTRSQGKHENKNVYTFNCEMFSFGMLLWELGYEKMPYEGWSIERISDHVLSGKREKLSNGRFINPDDKKIQLEFIKIIQDGALPKFDDNPEIDCEIPEEAPIIPFEEGLKMHQNKDYDGAWECFNQNAELNNPLAKFWLGYYLLYGHYHEQKDPIKARQLFKEAADEHNHSEAQCRYAVSLLSDLKTVTNETEKSKLCKEILHYLESAAGNSENPSIDAMYYLGDIYVGGKLRVKKDKERGLNYLRVAASNQNERAIALLAKLGK
ncbi:9960_t:CDS:2 [Gigaspora margarita]|uniref:9960_t:CDS:1 n=1 Tax=Gigaspora margarita TaxID=4874 RepID=A0ABN7VIW6_GIGMA|nr:9960_t:CDS:2 [Gigaspora margarita]